MAYQFPLGAQQPGFQPLRHVGHTLDDLKNLAITYTRLDSSHRTFSQAAALTWLLAFLVLSPFRTNPEHLRHSPVTATRIVMRIGQLFFLDGLRDVRLIWYSNVTFNSPGWTKHHAPGQPDEIWINIGCPMWLLTPVEQRWKLLLQVLLHESAHLYFGRYGMARPSRSSGHFSCWQLVAEAVETAASSLFHVPLDLNRAQNLISEHECGQAPIITQAELRQCLGSYSGSLRICSLIKELLSTASQTNSARSTSL